MGVYFKDMRMPENCFRCPAHEWYDFGGKDHGYKCAAMVVGNPQYGKVISNCDARMRRMEHCPAMPADDHGRLVDADKLSFAMMDCRSGDEALCVLDEAPTVIPEERCQDT